MSAARPEEREIHDRPAGGRAAPDSEEWCSWFAVCEGRLRVGSAYGIRTRVTAVRGRRPGPLDECAGKLRGDAEDTEGNLRGQGQLTPPRNRNSRAATANRLARTLTKDEIFDLPVDERLHLIETLWDSIDPHEIPLPESHRRALDV